MRTVSLARVFLHTVSPHLGLLSGELHPRSSWLVQFHQVFFKRLPLILAPVRTASHQEVKGFWGPCLSPWIDPLRVHNLMETFGGGAWLEEVGGVSIQAISCPKNPFSCFLDVCGKLPLPHIPATRMFCLLLSQGKGIG